MQALRIYFFLWPACCFWSEKERKQKFQYLFLRYAGQIAFTKSDCETGEDELTGFDGIFFRIRPVILQMEIDCL